MDHSAPRPGRDDRSTEQDERVLVDVIAARAVLVCERLKRLDRVEDVDDVRSNGDSAYARHSLPGGSKESGTPASRNRYRQDSTPSRRRASRLSTPPSGTIEC